MRNGYLSPESSTYSLSFTEHFSFSAQLVHGLNRPPFVDLDPSPFSVAFPSVGASPTSVNVGHTGWGGTGECAGGGEYLQPKYGIGGHVVDNML